MFSEEQRNKLIELYPYLLPVNVFTGKYDPDLKFINGEQLPDGWFKLFLLLCKNIKPYVNNDFYFMDIKEKYGTMTIYTTPCHETAKSLIDVYESFSKYICSKCGKYTTTNMTYDWIMYLCDECVSCVPVDHTRITKQKSAKYECYRKGNFCNIYHSYKTVRKEYQIVENMTEDQFFSYLTNI